jgi:hypothetical protein
VPARIQILVSGGCFPTSGAKAPLMSPISTATG